MSGTRSKSRSRSAPYPPRGPSTRFSAAAVEADDSATQATQTDMVQAMFAALQPLMEKLERLESASAAAKPAVSLSLVPVSTSGSSAVLSAPISVASAFPAPTMISNAPCVPDRLRDRIIRDEFVEFDELLPERIGAEGSR